jgi:hypothetical protein
MTRKDYILIAQKFHQCRDFSKRYPHAPSQQVRQAVDDEMAFLANVLATAFERENPRFDRNKFLKACSVEQDSEITRLSAKNQRRHHE